MKIRGSQYYGQQVTGTAAMCSGTGIALITLQKSGVVVLLHPCYHMPDNPQDTLGLPALKHYSRMRSVRIETLSWLRIVAEKGKVFEPPPYHTTTQLS